MTNTKNSIQFVPADLVVKTVKLLKEGKAAEMVAALEMTEKMSTGELNLDLVRRLVVLAVLEEEGMSDRDRVWMQEMGNVRRVFLGVWQARVTLEALVAGWLLLCSGVKVSEEMAQLAANSLADQIHNGELVDWLVSRLERSGLTG